MHWNNTALVISIMQRFVCDDDARNATVLSRLLKTTLICPFVENGFTIMYTQHRVSIVAPVVNVTVNMMLVWFQIITTLQHLYTKTIQCDIHFIFTRILTSYFSQKSTAGSLQTAKTSECMSYSCLTLRGRVSGKVKLDCLPVRLSFLKASVFLSCILIMKYQFANQFDTLTKTH